MVSRNHTRQIAFFFAAMLLIGSCGGSSSRTDEANPPKIPVNLQAQVEEGGVGLYWDCVPGATHYTVFWGTEREQYRHIIDSKDCFAKLGGLKKGWFYAFAVTAWNERGESDLSREREIVYDDDPAKAADYLAKGSDFMVRGFYASAHTYLSAAIRLAPENAQAYRSRAKLYEKVNRPDLAKEDYRTAKGILKQKPISLK